MLHQALLAMTHSSTIPQSEELQQSFLKEAARTCASTQPEAGVNRREASRDFARAVTRSVSYWPAHIALSLEQQCSN